MAFIFGSPLNLKIGAAKATGTSTATAIKDIRVNFFIKTSKKTVALEGCTQDILERFNRSFAGSLELPVKTFATRVTQVFQLFTVEFEA